MLSFRDINGGKRDEILQSMRKRVGRRGGHVSKLRLCSAGTGEPAGGKPSTGLNILAFLFPLVGLILFLCFQKTTPVRAKAIGKWALDGFVVGVALSILSGVLGVILGAMYA